MSRQHKAVFISNRPRGLTISRIPILRHLRNKKWKVTTLTSKHDDWQRLKNESSVWKETLFSRKFIDPLGDLKTLFSLIRTFTLVSPDLIHSFNPKPIIIGNLAAFLSPSTIVINTITGLGSSYPQNTILRFLYRLIFRAILTRANSVVFQNAEDKDLFISSGIIPERKAILIVSSGVDLNKFTYFDKIEEPPKVLMACRLIWQKGIQEYIDASKICKTHRPELNFILAGNIETDHPDGVPESYLTEQSKTGTIEFIGYSKDLASELKGSYAFVLPSYYREGAPRVVLEAAACGIPSIVADSPGCRDIVVDGKTGFIVRPKSASELAESIMRILADQRLRNKLGSNARTYIEQKFTTRIIVDKYLGLYKQYNLPC